MFFVLTLCSNEVFQFISYQEFIRFEDYFPVASTNLPLPYTPQKQLTNYHVIFA